MGFLGFVEAWRCPDVVYHEHLVMLVIRACITCVPEHTCRLLLFNNGTTIVSSVNLLPARSCFAAARSS